MPGRNNVNSARELNSSDINALITRNYIGLQRLLTKRTGNFQDASDLLQDATRIIWEKWCAGLVQRPEQIGGYIFQVAMNLLRNRRRFVVERAERRANIEQIDRECIAVRSAESEAAGQQISVKQNAMTQAVSSPRDRAVLVRFCLDGEEKSSICRDLQLKVRQFDRILHRARQRLRESPNLDEVDLVGLPGYLQVGWTRCSSEKSVDARVRRFACPNLNWHAEHARHPSARGIGSSGV
jgi:RNA polymerase sigma factor (sigma-70 family)